MSILPASGVGDVSTGFYPVQIDQSLRLDGTSAHLSKTYSTTASSTTDFVMSLWLKPILKDTGNKMIASSYDGATVMMYWQFQSTRTLRIYIDPSSAGSNEFHVTTDMHFRDCSNWYNICLVLDMSQSSNVDKAKIYVNGTQASTTQTYSTGTPTTQNLVKSGTTFNISKYFTSSQYMDAYIADVHIIDGSANYTDFGELKNGVWIPKKYSGSYGNNGTRLTFQDSSNIGYDYQTADRSTTNDFTANNLASTDVMPDSPTNNFCTLNSLSAGDETDMTEGNLTYADNRSSGTGQAKGTFPLSSGKWYWEVHYDYDPGASNMIGIVAVDEITNSHTAQDPNTGFGTYFAWDERGLYYEATDGSHSNTSGHTSYSAGDIISFAMDVDAGKLFIRKNDGSFEDSGDPVNGTNPSFTFTANKVMTPIVLNYRSSRHVFNFGQNPSFNSDGSITAGTQTDSGGVGLFVYAPPTDYLAICSKNLPDVTIGPDSTSQADDHFNTALYTGDGNTTQDVTGVGFKPDFTWGKERNSTSGHWLVDSSRGYENYLSSQTTNDESTGITNNNASRSNDGFQTTASGASNESGKTYASWNWLCGGSTPTKTYKVVVVSDGGNKYRFRNSADNATFAQSAVTLNLQEGGTYTFDLSDSSVDGHPMKFSTTSNGSHGGGSTYSTGVVYKLDGVTKTESDYVSEFNSATTRQLIITVASSAPTLYYWCHYHSGMGGQINTNTTHGSTNFDGDIISVVQTNESAGFSILKFTGNGVNGSTLGHGLGVKPAWYIVKDRDTNTYGHWMVYHHKVPDTGGTSRGNADNLWLNLTNGQNAQGFGTTDPASATTIKPAVTLYTNNNGSDYVAYVFAEIEGYSKFDIFTGNNSTDGIFVYTNFRPAWIMIKATAQTESWGIHDNARNTFNVVDNNLLANVSNAENAVGTARQQLDFLSNGFKLRNAGDANPSINNESTTYVYMAFAEQPFKFSNGR